MPAAVLNATTMTSNRRKQQAHTLLEMLIVVTIITLVATLALPSLSTGDTKKVDLAAAEVANAIRFARSEAMRTGEGHGITVSQVTQRVTVKKYDISITPISTLGTLTHPINKHPYDFNVNTSASTRGVMISNSDDIFEYESEDRRRSLIFDPNGVPIWIIGSDPTRHLLVDGTVELSYRQHERRVNVSSMTGRVTVQ